MGFQAADLDAIERAIATGELSVRKSDGSMVTYRSTDELLKARATMVASMNRATGRPRVGFSVARFDE
jgi:hypothetical protein